MTPKLHKYSPVYKISESFYVILSLFSIVAGLFFLYVFFNSLVAGKIIDINSELTSLVYFLGSVIWSLILFTFFAYLLSDIETQNDGMKIRILWKKYLIKWDEIVEIKPFRPFGLFTNKNAKVIIVNKKLTFFHRLYGLIYAGKYQSAILVYRIISEYDLLIESISTQAKLNQ